MIVDPPHGLDEPEERIAEMISHPGEFSIELTSITGVLPKTSAGSFPIQPTVIAILDTLLREVPRHLVEQLTAAQNRYYISLSEAEHIENALRRLHNHSLLQHDGKWLFTPTRSERVWACEEGRLG